MHLLFTSFFAGVLTVLAPCILPLLPVILGGSVGGTSKLRPLIVACSFAVSVILFTILLKGLTLFIAVPAFFWQVLSGGLLIIIGSTLIFPKAWDVVAQYLHLHSANAGMQQNVGNNSIWGAVLLGFSLGPVFSTCSPTYGLIIATVLPADFLAGLLYIVVYALGTMVPLLLIGYGGRAVVQKFKSTANPNGWFKKILGVLLIVVGILFVSGLDKALESKILDSGYTGPIEIEQALLKDSEDK